MKVISLSRKRDGIKNLESLGKHVGKEAYKIHRDFPKLSLVQCIVFAQYVLFGEVIVDEKKTSGVH